jgi:hypothetical protein
MDVALNGALVYCNYSLFFDHRLNICDELLEKLICCYKSKNWPTSSVNHGRILCMCICMYVCIYLFIYLHQYNGVVNITVP